MGRSTRLYSFCLAVTCSLLPSSLNAQDSTMISDHEYSLVRPIEAVDLNNPLKFKPVFGAEIGFISLTRETPDPFQFISDGNGASLLNFNEMQGDAGAGLDAVINLYNLFSDCKPLDMHFRFFQAGQMEFDEYLGAPQIVPLFYGGVPVNPVNAEHVEYDTLVRSFEANFAYRLPLRFRLVAGFRFFEIEERLDVSHTTGSTTLGFRSSVEDMMYGGQVGIESVPWAGRYGRIQGAVKWAYMGNEINGQANAQNAAGNPISTRIDDTVDSQLLDLQLGGMVYFTRSISLYAGYQGIIAYDVALAPIQSQNASIFVPTNPPTLSDTQFHGFNMRLVTAW